MEDTHEEKLLRAVTLQNARAILQARERAEQELLQAKEELERSNQQITELLAREREVLAQAEKEIADRKQVEQALRESQVLVDSQRQALQMLAEGAPRDEVLAFLIGVVERHSAEEMLAAISPLNEAGTHFQRGVGARLPDAFNAAVEGVAVSSPTGLCAIAVRRREAVAVHDFNADPGWQPFGDFVAPYGLRSGWSVPIISSSGHILGTFANYSRHTGDPTPQNRDLVNMVVRTAAIAIERHRAEEARARFAALVESSDDGIVGKTLEGVITSWNAGAERIFGYLAEEIIGQPITTIIPPNSRDEETEIMARLRRGERIEHFETVRLAKNGQLIEVSLSISPIRDAAGQIIGASKIARDITERKRAEETVRESEERFRSLVSVITDVPWIADPTGAFIARQPAWGAYTGQSWEEHRGFGWANALHPEDRERVQAEWQRACESRALYQTDGRLWHAPTKQWRYFTVKATPILNTDGSVREWVGTCTDVDLVKRVEAERARLLASEQQARQEAEEANRLKDEFLATVSHELRTPLNAMLGWLRLLRGGQLGEAEGVRALETVERNARAQNQLIADLLDISRIISGKLRFEMGVVELVTVIESALEAVRPAAETKGVELRLTLDPTAGLVSGDAGRLQQVIWNLLTNAVKYTPRGGHVETRLERKESHAAIIVRDSGEGISEDFLPYVFARFQQADGGTTRKHGGLGLGLAIVRHLVEAHGGRVSAASEGAGRGATFTVTLPLIAARKYELDAEHAGTVPMLSPDSLRGLRVLVVDDDADARDLLSLALTRSGAEVRAAANAGTALDLLSQWQPGVLVSDIGMPGEDGYELMRQVRALPAERGGQIPAVAVTGYARLQDESRALAAGFQMLVSKPVDLTELQSVIARLVVTG